MFNLFILCITHTSGNVRAPIKKRSVDVKAWDIGGWKNNEVLVNAEEDAENAANLEIHKRGADGDAETWLQVQASDDDIDDEEIEK